MTPVRRKLHTNRLPDSRAFTCLRRLAYRVTLMPILTRPGRNFKQSTRPSANAARPGPMGGGPRCGRGLSGWNRRRTRENGRKSLFQKMLPRYSIPRSGRVRQRDRESFSVCGLPYGLRTGVKKTPDPRAAIRSIRRRPPARGSLHASRPEEGSRKGEGRGGKIVARRDHHRRWPDGPMEKRNRRRSRAVQQLGAEIPAAGLPAVGGRECTDRTEPPWPCGPRPNRPPIDHRGKQTPGSKRGHTVKQFCCGSGVGTRAGWERSPQCPRPTGLYPRSRNFPSPVRSLVIVKRFQRS